jgi:hypothetical protein
VIEHAAGARQLGLGGVGLADEVRVDGAGGQRDGMSGGGRSTKLMSPGAMPSSSISLVITRYWLEYLLGRANRLALEVAQARGGESLGTITVEPSRWPR